MEGNDDGGLLTEFLLPPHSSAGRAGGRLFRSVMPFSASQDPERKAFGIWQSLKEESYTQGRSKGVLVIITPPAEELERSSSGDYSEAMLRQSGFVTRQMTIDGFAPDKVKLVEECADFALTWLEAGGFVISHCNSGFGRGSILPALLYAKLHGKVSVDDDTTIDFVHDLDPRIIPSEKAKTFNFFKDIVRHLSR